MVSEEFPSVIGFTPNGTVTSIRSKIARHDALPELVLAAEEALEIAKDAVKTKYQLWFLRLREARGIPKEGEVRPLFWYSRRPAKVVLGWKIRFVNVRGGRGYGIHTILVDGTSGEAKLLGRPQALALSK